MHIVILGNGIAGITAARHIRKLSDHRITVISGESDYFFSRPALMYIYMGHMKKEHTEPYERWFWKKNRIELHKGWVEQVVPEKKRLIFADGSEMHYDKLLLATGSRPNKFGWPGQDLDGVHGFYSLQDLEAIEYHSKNLQQAVIVGGGLIGIELAEMFRSRNIPVIFLVREKSYWDMVLPPEESEMINRHIREHHIDLRLETELKEIWGDEQGKAKMVVTSKGDKIRCGFVGLTAGVHPNVDFLRLSSLEIDRGILVDEYLQTNIEDIYAAGDCVQLRKPPAGRRPIEAVWYVGRMMGETAAYNLCGQARKYEPGIWFNSAKFLDIEYQVYGQLTAHIPEEQATIYWEHSKEKKSLRIAYDKRTRAVKGFLSMGLRLRHLQCEAWIQSETPVDKVLQNLKAANFDPEFFPDWSKEPAKLI